MTEHTKDIEEITGTPKQKAREYKLNAQQRDIILQALEGQQASYERQVRKYLTNNEKVADIYRKLKADSEAVTKTLR